MAFREAQCADVRVIPIITQFPRFRPTHHLPAVLAHQIPLCNGTDCKNPDTSIEDLLAGSGCTGGFESHLEDTGYIQDTGYRIQATGYRLQGELV